MKIRSEELEIIKLLLKMPNAYFAGIATTAGNICMQQIYGYNRKAVITIDWYPHNLIARLEKMQLLYKQQYYATTLSGNKIKKYRWTLRKDRLQYIPETKELIVQVAIGSI